MFKKLLVPVDLTEPGLTKRAIDEALTLVKSSEGQLRLV
ncbi:MAG: universal stress protein, partial [Methylocystis sp.]|nr:universal stress protein [Methylocystis sp.]